MQTSEEDMMDMPPHTIEDICSGLSGDLGHRNYNFGMHIAELSILNRIDDATFMENMRKAAVAAPLHYAAHGLSLEESIRAIVDDTAVAVTRRRQLLAHSPLRHGES
ncbi:MAG: hypothetical protein ACTIDN_07005 [Acetobacter sp.]|uniref:hypothetical protein n=1 Tax=Acetobacter sp. TaxID=440 RepID=UPI003F933474